MILYCHKCKSDKDSSQFSKSNQSKSGFHYTCKDCCKLNYLKNKALHNLKSQEWYRANKLRKKDTNQKWASEHKGDQCCRSMKRYVAKLKRIPKWLNEEDWNYIKCLYQTARQLTLQTGIPHEVDHIIPLQGENISGLHCPLNLQILTKTENCSKKNKFPLEGNHAIGIRSIQRSCKQYRRINPCDSQTHHPKN